jgi:hypothetical protein
MYNFGSNLDNNKSNTSEIKFFNNFTSKQLIQINESLQIELKILITVILSLIDFMTFSGNLLVIIAIVSTKTLQTITNLFILSLAVADMLVSILVMPLSIITIAQNHKWYFGQIICDLYISSDIMLCTASILNLCCISLDRYFAITRPLVYCRKRSTKLARKMIGLVWIGSILITCPPVFGWNDENRSINNCNLNTLLSYRIFSSTGSFFLPCTVMIFVYLRIFKVIHEREKYLMNNSANFLKLSNSLHNSNQYKITKMQDKFKCSNNFPKKNKNIVLSSSLKFNNLKLNKKNFVHKFGKSQLINKSSFNSNFSTTSFYVKNKESLSDIIKNKKSSFYLDERQEDYHKKSNKSKSKSKSYNDLLFINNLNLDSAKLNNVVKAKSKLNKNDQTDNWNMESNYFDLNNDSLKNLKLKRKIASFTQSKSKRGILKHSNSNTEQQIGLLKESKAAKTLSVLVGSFILAWGPFFVMYIIEVIFPNLISIEVVDIITWIGYLNSTFNPIIYAWYSQQFREAFYRLTINKIKISRN